MVRFQPTFFESMVPEKGTPKGQMSTHIFRISPEMKGVSFWFLEGSFGIGVAHHHHHPLPPSRGLRVALIFSSMLLCCALIAQLCLTVAFYICSFTLIEVHTIDIQPKNAKIPSRCTFVNENGKLYKSTVIV